MKGCRWLRRKYLCKILLILGILVTSSLIGCTSDNVTGPPAREDLRSEFNLVPVGEIPYNTDNEPDASRVELATLTEVVEFYNRGGNDYGLPAWRLDTGSCP